MKVMKGKDAIRGIAEIRGDVDVLPGIWMKESPHMVSLGLEISSLAIHEERDGLDYVYLQDLAPCNYGVYIYIYIMHDGTSIQCIPMHCFVKGAGRLAPTGLKIRYLYIATTFPRKTCR